MGSSEATGKLGSTVSQLQPGTPNRVGRTIAERWQQQTQHQKVKTSSQIVEIDRTGNNKLPCKGRGPSVHVAVWLKLETLGCC